MASEPFVLDVVVLASVTIVNCVASTQLDQNPMKSQMKNVADTRAALPSGTPMNLFDANTPSRQNKQPILPIYKRGLRPTLSTYPKHTTVSQSQRQLSYKCLRYKRSERFRESPLCTKRR